MVGRTAKGIDRRTLLRAGMAVAAAPLTRVLRARADPTPELEADVCIIGSGPAGAILGCALARRGLSVLLVESGPALDAPRDPRALDLDVYSTNGALGYPLAATRFRGAGGTSNLWSGSCPRMQPIDFEVNAYTPRGAPWPIRYEDLEPYYFGAEVELQVFGVDGTPYTPPRRDPFPFQMKAAFPVAEELMRRRGIDLALYRLPRSTDQPVGLRVARTHLPELAASRCATVVTDATATRVQAGPRGRIDGIRLEGFTQPPRLARARAYVIACGGVESARLLLLSGLGNRSDEVGRNFMEHVVVLKGIGVIDVDWPVTPHGEWLCTEEFQRDAKRRGLGSLRIRPVFDVLPAGDGGAPRQVKLTVRAEIECQPSAANRVTLSEQRDAFGNPGAQLALDFTDADRRTIDYCETLVWRLLAQFGATDVTIDRVPTWGHHHMGTCRMGDDPRTSVVDRNLRVHGTTNLYVASSGAFVTTGISNPTLTIVALSLRLAEHLTHELRG